MALPRGIRYVGGGGTSGYGQAALAHVRLFVNAGIPVHWIPVEWSPQGMKPSRWSDADGKVKPLLGPLGGGAATSDAAALVAKTARPIPVDTVIAHTPPETWYQIFEHGKRNLGHLTWETDAPPAHWLPLLHRAHAVVVPCRLNREVFQRAGLRRPIGVVPHVRRHVWTEYSPDDLAATREDLGIPAQNTVFYSINAWDPRKDLPRLIAAYARAFQADDPVTLLIKTQELGYDAGPLYPQRSTQALAARIAGELQVSLGRPLPQIVVHDEEIDSAGIDLIHAIGDVYVSLSRGEGWGLGAFEAATRGTPVLMTGWGGHTDFLGNDWPGAVPYRLVQTVLWPPYQPSYFPSQRWAEADVDAAARMMRDIVTTPAPARAAALRIREQVVQRYGEPRVWHDWRAAFDV